MALTRRQAILGTGLAGAGALLGRGADGQTAPPTGRVVTKGRLKQSVSWWCYQRIRAENRDRPLPEFARAVKEMGLTAIDLLKEDEWPVVRDLGLVCSMGYGGGGTIPDGLNNKANHDTIVKGLEKTLPKAAHFPHLEDPEGLAAVLRDFLETTEPVLIEDADWGDVVNRRRVVSAPSAGTASR